MTFPIWLFHPGDGVDLIDVSDPGRQAPVDTEELFVHHRSQGQSVKRLHTRLVHPQRIFGETFLLVSETLCQVTTFMVACQ